MTGAILPRGFLGRRPRVRSLPRSVAAALLVVTVLGGGVAFAANRVRSAPSLLPTSADQLIASVLTALEHPRPVSGEVIARIDLGLPSIPGQVAEPTGLAGAIAALSGDHRVRVWSSQDGLRIDQLLTGNERALYVNREGVWGWDSATFTASHLVEFPAGLPSLSLPSVTPPAETSQLMGLTDPLTIARTAMQALSPTTTIGLPSPVRVAGRSAYVLALTPSQPGTLVGRVELYVDADTRLPLGAAIFAKGASSPAVSVEFTSISFAPIDPRVYAFAPPKGARVTEPYRDIARQLADIAANRGSDANPPAISDQLKQLTDSVEVFGSGWETVVAIRLPSLSQGTDLGNGLSLQELLPFSGPLFSIRLAARGDHDWLIAGAVPQASLASVEPSLP